jgi:hypothetical protein
MDGPIELRIRSFHETPITCAIKATNIWDVRNVATVEGGIIVKDLIIQMKPNIPIHPTPKDVAISFSGISLM